MRTSSIVRSMRTTAITMIGTLLSFWSVREIEHAAHLTIDVVVQAVALGVMLGRAQRTTDLRGWLIGLAVLPVAGMAAGAVGGTAGRHANAGDALFVLAVSATIWVRRFGARTATAGTLVTLPFVAVLVTPLPQPSGPAYVLWSGLVALITYGWSAAVVAIFGILALATLLRPLNYAYWAGCITAALALLYGYFGQSGSDLLRTRLGGILAGGLVGVAAAWFVLPVRTDDVLRQADALIRCARSKTSTRPCWRRAGALRAGADPAPGRCACRTPGTRCPAPARSS